jgi:hypothetical protein
VAGRFLEGRLLENFEPKQQAAKLSATGFGAPQASLEIVCHLPANRRISCRRRLRRRSEKASSTKLWNFVSLGPPIERSC